MGNGKEGEDEGERAIQEVGGSEGRGDLKQIGGVGLNRGIAREGREEGEWNAICGQTGGYTENKVIKVDPNKVCEGKK